MTYTTVRVEQNDGVATILLDRPAKLNAPDATLLEELYDAVTRLGANQGTKALIFSGSDPRAFSAGADVRDFATRTTNEGREFAGGPRIYDLVARCDKPTIAAVSGYCLGGGAELALSCDLRVADPSARFGQPEIRLGLIPGGGGTQRLTRLVGPGQAMRLALTGEVVDANEAYRIGLVEFLAEGGRCLETAREIAGQIGRWSSTALRLVKESVRTALETPLSAGLRKERELFLVALSSDEGQEGIREFLKKSGDRVRE